MQQKPKSAQEVEANSKEIQVLIQKLLKETVNPEPKVEHQTEIFKVLCDLTNAVINEAQFFRKNHGPKPTKSNTAGAADSQAPKRDP